MNENMEAERFAKGLDSLLAGKKGGEALDAELAKDMEFAEKLVCSDKSGESKVRRSLKEKLLAQPKPSRLESWGVRPWAFAAGLAAVLISPIVLQRVSQRHSGEVRTASPASQVTPPITTGNPPMEMASFRRLFHGDSNQAVNKAPGYMGVGSRGQAKSMESLAFLAGASNMAAVAAVRGGGAAGNEMYLTESRSSYDVQPSNLPSPAPTDREGYRYLAENEFLKAKDAPLSTFSIDVDVASYANVRRMLNASRLPPADAVRLEEFINYFHYSYPEPDGDHPFSITADQAACPWKPEHKLVRVAIKGKSIPKAELPPSNLVFLIDSSGSMMAENKLPLVQKSLRLLVNELRPQDRVAIVTYAGSAGLILDSTSGERKADIIAAIDRLQAGGSTAGAQGIQLAYQVALKNFLRKGNNRVILATDGDFNVGVSDDGSLVRLIESEREKGVFLSVLGVGGGNYQDAKMQQLADKGNGNYAYLDDIAEAQKVLVSQLAGTLYAVAKDMKLQVEFNPAKVQAYRLIGYEKRALKAEDFNNDKKDAGELGSGHTVTALYELIPPGVKTDLPDVDELKYQKTAPVADAQGAELLAVKVRYKDPDGTKSKLLTRPLADQGRAWAEAAPDFKFAAAAAGFGMLLRGSAFAGDLTYDKVADLARSAAGKDPDGYRGEFLRLVEKARLLKGPDAR
jgi:Ca-activated chloride channel family protein